MRHRTLSEAKRAGRALSDCSLAYRCQGLRREGRGGVRHSCCTRSLGQLYSLILEVWRLARLFPSRWLVSRSLALISYMAKLGLVVFWDPYGYAGVVQP